jgi:hypothetical protein
MDVSIRDRRSRWGQCRADLREQKKPPGRVVISALADTGPFVAYTLHIRAPRLAWTGHVHRIAPLCSWQ